MALCLCGLPPQTQADHDKNIRQIQLRHSLKYLTSTPHSCQGHQNKERLRNCHSYKVPKETEGLNVMGSPGRGPGTGEGPKGKMRQ